MMNTLEAGAEGAGFPASLRSRVAAQTVMTEFLRAQARVKPRSRLARILGGSVLSEESERWYAGALGELAVGETLDRLGPEWVVLHAVPLEALEADIDHVVIGPTGVFALSTRNYSDQSVWIAKGAFEVAGRRRNHIRNSEFEVGHVERTLGAALGAAVQATGVIVVVDPKSITVREMPRDVGVVSSDELVFWLQSRPQVLSASEVEELAALAEKPATWLSTPAALEDGTRLRSEFDAVRREVRTAQAAHNAWLIAVTGVLLACLCLATWAVALAAMGSAG